MKLNKMLSLCAAAVLSAFTAGQATAGTLDYAYFDYTGTNPGASVRYTTNGTTPTGSSSSITAGRFNFNVSNPSNASVQSLVGSSILTWCVQLNEGLPSNYGKYYVYGGSYGAYQSPLATAGLMDKVNALFNQFYGGLNLSSNSDTGGFQLALWEILSGDTISGSSLTSGNFRAISTGSSDSNNAITKANNILSTLNVNGYKNAGTFIVYQLHNSSTQYGPYQDQIFAKPGTTTSTPPVVPVPAALPSGVALLAGLAIYRKMRRKSVEA